MTAFHVKLDWPADLPLIYADYVQMDRVVANLLENAIRFTPPDSTIEIAARAEAGRVTWPSQPRTGDLGKCTSALVRQVYRVPGKPWPQNMGTGLGLSICKGIVEARRSHLVESPVSGIGARATFTLPPTDVPARKLPEDEGLSDEENQGPDR
jgi:two-component system sensor histidine kinase KdpD